MHIIYRTDCRLYLTTRGAGLINTEPFKSKLIYLQKNGALTYVDYNFNNAAGFPQLYSFQNLKLQKKYWPQ